MPVLEFIRGLVFAGFAFSAAVALGNWAVRTRRISPSSRSARAIRRIGDPILGRLEEWLLRRGANPQNSGWWLLGIALVGGIVIVSVSEWIVQQLYRFSAASARGPFEVFQLVVYLVGQLVLLALVIRVIGSWFGLDRYHRWTGWTYPLTDWIIEPLSKIVPRLGTIDITPIVAWFAVQVLLGMFMRL